MAMRTPNALDRSDCASDPPDASDHSCWCSIATSASRQTEVGSAIPRYDVAPSSPSVARKLSSDTSANVETAPSVRGRSQRPALPTARMTRATPKRRNATAAEGAILPENAVGSAHELRNSTSAPKGVSRRCSTRAAAASRMTARPQAAATRRRRRLSASRPTAHRNRQIAALITIGRPPGTHCMRISRPVAHPRVATPAIAMTRPPTMPGEKVRGPCAEVLGKGGAEVSRQLGSRINPSFAPRLGRRASSRGLRRACEGPTPEPKMARTTGVRGGGPRHR